MRSSLSDKELRRRAQDYSTKAFFKSDGHQYIQVLEAYIAGWKARERRARAMQDYDDEPLPKNLPRAGTTPQDLEK
jgi:hypothetical protein